MASKFTRSWETVRAEKPLNEKRVATYRRLMDAQERIAQARSRGGESDAKIDAALSLSELNDSEIEHEEDVYLTTLTRYVAALGGRLEVSAVFPEETITVLSEPPGPAQP